jgi:hypothetical protein
VQLPGLIACVYATLLFLQFCLRDALLCCIVFKPKHSKGRARALLPDSSLRVVIVCWLVALQCRCRADLCALLCWQRIQPVAW